MPKLTEEVVDQKRNGQDIELFLRLAGVRIKNGLVPQFNTKTALLTIDWLRAMAERYGNGEDITK